jgi:signal transduction histidine kinase
MHDRIEAIGGALSIEASPGYGTRVVGSVDVR